MLQFDGHGHLQPVGPTEISLADFELFFVENLDDRAHRRRLFDNYMLFLDELKNIIGPTFHQWVDGSFVSQKARPADLDLVTFVGFEIFHNKSNELVQLIANARIDWDIHSNVAFECGTEHPNFQDSLQYRYLWQRLFGKARPFENELPRQKGFIQLNFGL